MAAKPLQFDNLTLDDPNYDEDLTKGIPDSDTRLMEMLAAQAQHHGGEVFENTDAIAEDEKLSEDQKKSMLQKALHMAASNGDLDQVKKILNGKAKPFVDMNALDEDGTPPLVYASCFVSATSIICRAIHMKTDRLAGPRERGTSAGRCGCRRRQAGPQSLECLDVGHDE
jgi:hypothetical protein